MGTATKPTPEQRVLALKSVSEGVFVEPDDSRLQLGRTFVSANVITKLAGRVAAGVPGVSRLGATGWRRLASAVRGTVNATVGRTQATVSIELIVEYGYSLRAVVDEVRDRVTEAVRRMAGTDVVAIDISVADIHVGGQDRSGRRLE